MEDSVVIVEVVDAAVADAAVVGQAMCDNVRVACE